MRPGSNEDRSEFATPRDRPCSPTDSLTRAGSPTRFDAKYDWKGSFTRLENMVKSLEIENKSLEERQIALEQKVHEVEDSHVTLDDMQDFLQSINNVIKETKKGSEGNDQEHHVTLEDMQEFCEGITGAMRKGQEEQKQRLQQQLSTLESSLQQQSKKIVEVESSMTSVGLKEFVDGSAQHHGTPTGEVESFISKAIYGAMKNVDVMQAQLAVLERTLQQQSARIMELETVAKAGVAKDQLDNMQAQQGIHESAQQQVGTPRVDAESSTFPDQASLAPAAEQHAGLSPQAGLHDTPSPLLKRKIAGIKVTKAITNRRQEPPKLRSF